MKLLSAFFIAVVATLCASMMTLVSALSPVPSFELKLDLPPNQRWNGAVETIINAHGWDHSFGPVLALYLPITWVIPEEVITAFNVAMRTRYTEYYQEILGIYAQLVTYGKIDVLASQEQYVAIAFAYEILHAVPQDILSIQDPALRKIAEHVRNHARQQLIKEGRISASYKGDIVKFFTRACTGILSLPTNLSADILHLRNMDEQPSPARNLTLKITATRNGETQWEALDWLWFSSGVETSQRNGGVTLEMNYRDFFNQANVDNFTWTELAQRISAPTAVPVMLFHRVVHDKKLVYETAIDFAINTATFAAPFYTVMSGTRRRGAVLTIHPDRSRSFVAPINDTFNYRESDGLSHALVQTNYDILNGQPDNAGDDRRTVALNTLKMMGRERAGTELGVWMALSVHPVHNRDTFYTAILSVSKPIEGYVRRQMVPDPQLPLN